MGWKSIRKERPDPRLGVVLYRHRKPGRGSIWFLGLAYFTVSGKWGIDPTGQSWPPPKPWGMDIQWMEIPE